MLNLLKKLVSAAAEKQGDAAELYYSKVVVPAADEKEGDPEEALRIMEAAGKSIEDLEADVELLLQRRQWVAAVQREEQHAAKVAEAEEKIRKLGEKRRKLLEPIDKEISSLRDVIDAHREIQTAAMSAKRCLRENLPEWVKRKQEQLTVAVREKMKRHKKAKLQREGAEEALARARSELQQNPHRYTQTSDLKAAEDHIAACEKRVGQRRREEQEASAAAKQADADRDAVLEPLILSP